MEKMLNLTFPALILIAVIALLAKVRGEFVKPPPSLKLRSYAGEETRLPCEFKPQGTNQVVQVIWYREKVSGVKEQIITTHMKDGLQEFPNFAGRVRFASSDPIRDSTLLILNTLESDQAKYTCHITTFPSGNFESKIAVTVWRIPISKLDPVILQEGQSYRVAATCHSIGLPPPSLSWDTDVPGQVKNRTSEVITSMYFLHPLRGMNGRKLDCLVWHPALEQPHRLRNLLVVQFPPDAVISGYDQSWSVNRQGAELRCEGEGNPQPHSYTWTRKSGSLPKDVSVEGNKLLFNRPLNITDEGIYECEAKNTVGSVKTEVNVKISATEASRMEASFNNFLLIIVGGAAGVLIVVMTVTILLVTCNHKRRTKKLKRELREKKEEINNLSRQTSMRRLNSVSTDPRIQAEESVLIGMDSPIRCSVFSLEQENSVMCERRDGYRESEYDSLGRPAIYPVYYSDRGSMRRKELEVERQDRAQRVASFIKNSNMTLNMDPHRVHTTTPPPPPPPPPLSVGSGASREGGTEKDLWGQREGMPEGEEGDCTSGSHQLSEALQNHFHYSNGFLRPKPHPNSIILHPHSQVI